MNTTHSSVNIFEAIGIVSSALANTIVKSAVIIDKSLDSVLPAIGAVEQISLTAEYHAKTLRTQAEISHTNEIAKLTAALEAATK